jgi:hypothetical protein
MSTDSYNNDESTVSELKEINKTLEETRITIHNLNESINTTLMNSKDTIETIDTIDNSINELCRILPKISREQCFDERYRDKLSNELIRYNKTLPPALSSELQTVLKNNDIKKISHDLVQIPSYQNNYTAACTTQIIIGEQEFKGYGIASSDMFDGLTHPKLLMEAAFIQSDSMTKDYIASFLKKSIDITPYPAIEDE